MVYHLPHLHRICRYSLSLLFSLFVIIIGVGVLNPDLFVSHLSIGFPFVSTGFSLLDFFLLFLLHFYTVKS